jgi:transposase
MSQNNKSKTRRTFISQVKQQIIVYRSDKRKCDIIREYGIAPSLLDKWLAQVTNTGPFKGKKSLA